ncbi:MAG: 4Fe-4S dicluster domain-containing protein [Deltaproteobacteria bacterium]|nr:4Fe-4S dicluster domain-containing protein [Deltaproteobacteria bacterium]
METEKGISMNRITRRKFLVGTAAGMLMTSCGPKRLYELARPDLREALDRMEKEYAVKYGKAVKVGSEGPIKGVKFAYALDLSRCIGCRTCVHACVHENNQSRDPEIQWIRVAGIDKERGVDLTHADYYYHPDKVPEPGKFYVPIQCQQCDNPPCTKVCPVKATWKEPDGIVVVDYEWCIGCRYCMAACPYGARHFNWGEPGLDPADVNPDTHYLGNRPRPKGVVEKCTFCIQRTRKGRYPACVEACPVGARKFGNILDPDSEVRYVIENKRVLVLKEELNTIPSFFYFYGV